MTRWLRFTRDGAIGFGTLDGDTVHVHRGDMFGTAEPTGERLAAGEIAWTTPCAPSKMIALLNNSRALLDKAGKPAPAEPLFFLKAPNAFAGHDAVVSPPRSYTGRVLYEGELGVVIGKAGRDIAPEVARDHVFGYTCVNDITAFDLFAADPGHEQWTRAKGFDGFGPFGPVIATDVDLEQLKVRTIVNGRERQNYALGDLIFSPLALVSLVSRDVTLLPGDVISCGTSLGVGPLKPGNLVEIAIDGVGVLANRYGEPAG